MAEVAKLTTKQRRAIPVMLGARSCEEGCKAARISKTTFYEWMRDATFRAEFERQRDELAKAAFDMLAQNLEKAVSTLVGLLETTDERVRRLAANDVIGTYLKQKELKEFEERIAAIEARLETRV